jgi:hypothetical protein
MSKKNIAKVSIVALIALAVVVCIVCRTPKASAMDRDNNAVVIDTVEDIVEPALDYSYESTYVTDAVKTPDTTVVTDSIEMTEEDQVTVFVPETTVNVTVNKQPDVTTTVDTTEKIDTTVSETTKTPETEVVAPDAETTAPDAETTAPETEVVAPETTAPDTTPVEPEHVHKYIATETIAANCTTSGYTVFACDCGDMYNDDYTAPIKHNYSVKVVDATTTEQGYTQHFCNDCGDCYRDNYTDVIPETVAPETEKPETQDGLTDTICGCTDEDHQHAEVKVGGYTYIYCTSVKAPYRSEDKFTIFYPYEFYF